MGVFCLWKFTKVCTFDMLAFFVCIIYLIKELKKSYQTFLFFSKVLLACLANQGLSLSSLHCISAVTLMHRDLFSSCFNQVPFPVWDSSLEGIGFFFLSLSASFSENGPVWTSGLQEFFWKFLWINVLIPLYFHMRKVLANIYSLGFTNSLPKG